MRSALERVVSYSISTSNHNDTYDEVCEALVVSYSISTSNHNLYIVYHNKSKLYLIPFLHQTTTHSRSLPLLIRCILFHFYIKPQLKDMDLLNNWCCILFHFYIKPQLLAVILPIVPCCILFHFYIKPQLYPIPPIRRYVVSYAISTSNHNRLCSQLQLILLYLIPFLHQTTT